VKEIVLDVNPDLNLQKIVHLDLLLIVDLGSTFDYSANLNPN
jgi:hypothetical protein